MDMDLYQEIQAFFFFFLLLVHFFREYSEVGINTDNHVKIKTTGKKRIELKSIYATFFTYRNEGVVQDSIQQ